MRLPQIESPPVESVVGPSGVEFGGDAPVIVVVGGVDPGGGAGLHRDVATVVALGARPHAIETAVTEQGPDLHRVEPRAPDAVRAALADALATLRPAAVKIGMAVGPATAAALLEALGDYGGPVVVDPVLATSRGGALWAAEPRELLPLLRRATLVTPNSIEAAALSDRSVTTSHEAAAAGQALVERDMLCAVLVKGGHLAPMSDMVTDVLVTEVATEEFRRARVSGPSPRGTGCALASAIAIMLAREHALPRAVSEAGAWLAQLIAAPTQVHGEWHLPATSRR